MAIIALFIPVLAGIGVLIILFVIFKGYKKFKPHKG
jgi:ABC-type arginine/histidine transport system permease subunit